jgi:nucleoside-diphosphate-sugar epimerase
MLMETAMGDNYRVLVTGGSGFIGTNMVQYCIDRHITVLNADIAKPRNKDHDHCWRKADICDFEGFHAIMKGFLPTHVVHLAARTDLDGKALDDYRTNIEGVENVIRAIDLIGSVIKAVFASSMLVCSLGYTPKDYLDYNPSTAYGESKVKTELIVHEHAAMACQWTIVRPTSIWGPWFAAPYRNFFDLLAEKRFFHMNGKVCTKTYGYVGNTVFQIALLLFDSSERLHGKIFYLGDKPPIKISDWADEILTELGRSPAKGLPFWFFRGSALLGDILGKMGVRFPMTSFRLKNMTTDNIINLDDLYAATVPPPFSRTDGIKNTLDWLKKTDPVLYRVRNPPADQVRRAIADKFNKNCL